MALTQSYKDSVQKLVSRWQKEVPELNPGATDAEINRLETLISLRLPEDFRYLYSIVNGMPDLGEDNFLFSLWPIDLIIRDGIEFSHTKDAKKMSILAFADFLIDSHRYLLVFDEDGKSDIRVDAKADVSLCPSIEEFVSLYFSYPEKIWL